MNEIKSVSIERVKHWNARMRAEGKYMLVYTLGNGSMADEPRKRGFVVQKYHREGGERSKFHLSREKAEADYKSDKF